MEKGVKIESEFTAPCKVKILNDQTFKIILTEGKNIRIRRMCRTLPRSCRPQRIRIMNIELGTLPVGQFRNIEEKRTPNLFAVLDLA